MTLFWPFTEVEAEGWQRGRQEAAHTCMETYINMVGTYRMGNVDMRLVILVSALEWDFILGIMISMHFFEC